MHISYDSGEVHTSYKQGLYPPQRMSPLKHGMPPMSGLRISRIELDFGQLTVCAETFLSWGSDLPTRPIVRIGSIHAGDRIEF